MLIRFAQSARKHKIGKGHALEVMATATPSEKIRTDGTTEHVWYGPDSRGVMITVIGIIRPERKTGEPMLLIIHVQPDYNTKEEK